MPGMSDGACNDYVPAGGGRPRFATREEVFLGFALHHLAFPPKLPGEPPTPPPDDWIPAGVIPDQPWPPIGPSPSGPFGPPPPGGPLGIPGGGTTPSIAPNAPTLYLGGEPGGTTGGGGRGGPGGPADAGLAALFFTTVDIGNVGGGGGTGGGALPWFFAGLGGGYAGGPMGTGPYGSSHGIGSAIPGFVNNNASIDGYPWPGPFLTQEEPWVHVPWWVYLGAFAGSQTQCLADAKLAAMLAAYGWPPLVQRWVKQPGVPFSLFNPLTWAAWLPTILVYKRAVEELRKNCDASRGDSWENLVKWQKEWYDIDAKAFETGLASLRELKKIGNSNNPIDACCALEEKIKQGGVMIWDIKWGGPNRDYADVGHANIVTGVLCERDATGKPKSCELALFDASQAKGHSSTEFPRRLYQPIRVQLVYNQLLGVAEVVFTDPETGEQNVGAVGGSIWD